MKIAILDDYFDTLRTLPCFAGLAGHEVTIWNDHVQDVETLAERLRDAEALVLIRERTQIRAPLLERLARLRLISQRSVYPHIDVDACTRHRVIVWSNMHPGTPSYAAAELTWHWCSPRYASCHNRPWRCAAASDRPESATLCPAGRSASMATAGSARPLRSTPGLRDERAGLGARSVTRSRTQRRHKAAESKPSFFERLDVLSLHLRLADATRGIVTANDLASMKPLALLVNTSRARLIEPGALVGAPRAGRPGPAAVDVYRQEPLRDPSHPLPTMKNVVCTPARRTSAT